DLLPVNLRTNELSRIFVSENVLYLYKTNMYDFDTDFLTYLSTPTDPSLDNYQFSTWIQPGSIYSPVDSITITNVGTGYTSVPTVSISGGGGSGATATATITGIIDTISIGSGGSGYTAQTKLNISGGGGSGAI